MKTTSLVGIRLKLSAAFIAVSLMMVALVIGALNMQIATVERAALLQAERLVGAAAYAGAGNAPSTPEYLQAYVERQHALNSRDFVFVDSNRKGIADSDKAELGEIYDHDSGGEVAQTIRDGQARTFVEKNEHHPQGVRQIVIPLRKSLADAHSPIVGAAIVEYGDIYDGLIAKERTHLFVLAASGIGCVLLTMFFGLRIASKLAGRLKSLQDSANIIAAGNYALTVPITSRDEVGILSGAFNTMAAALKSSRDLLEERVASRTRDLTEANIGIKRLNRVHAVLSGINTLVVRVRDREELFKEACRIAHDEGGFPMAWIGVLDRKAMKIVLRASAGMDEGMLNAIKERFSGSLSEGEALGTSMASLAIRTKQAAISNDTVRDPRIVFTKKYSGAGVRSMAMLPLIVADESVGLLALYAGDVDFFHAEEMKLLTELAGDVAFAIDHIEQEGKLNYLSSYDQLTGLANRSLFHERLSQFLGTGGRDTRRLAVLVVDIERFRTINETLGRRAGDDLLKQFADRTRSHMIDERWLARIGGDQFASMIPDVTTVNTIRIIEQRLLEVLNAPFRVGETEVRVSVKIGIALFPDDGAEADTLLRNAEAALKRAKASGERYLFYAQEMTARVAENLALENRLRLALENEEFVLHYQPKVNLASGKLIGCEALIRWNDPRTGLVPPGRFIPVLEETGLIHEVGRWALRRAIEDYLRWRAAGLPAVRIAVNVSPLQLRNRGFVEEIKQVIGIDAAAAAGLELELTESLIMADVKHSISCLQAIRAMGVTIAIDDFGTGFSSLSYLAKLPVDTLKIDRSFVIDMTVGPDGLALVSTIINLAQSLRLKVVAEGVETEEQSRLLRLLRCDEMQGFLFSKPVPAETFEARFLAPKAELQPAT